MSVSMTCILPDLNHRWVLNLSEFLCHSSL
uniref:Superoxide dismutase (SOD-1) gene exon 5 and 3' flanking region n=1 Tax=Homo sapiens TaxID=9606 RepID=V9H1E3_HUMAN|nr:unnamed protein product [Homo sapiens]